MSWAMVREVTASRSLKPSERIALVVLIQHANDYRYPGQAALAAECGMKERQFRNVLKSLEAAGWVKSKRAGFNAPLSYTVRQPIAAQSGNPLPPNSSFTPPSTPPSTPHSNVEQAQPAQLALTPDTRPQTEAEQIRDVLEYWRQVTGQPKAKIVAGGSRWKRVKARLKEGASVNDLKAAAYGATRDPWISGRDSSSPVHRRGMGDDGLPRDKRFLKVSTIYRDEEQVEKLAEHGRKTRRVAEARARHEEQEREQRRLAALPTNLTPDVAEFLKTFGRIGEAAA